MAAHGSVKPVVTAGAGGTPPNNTFQRTPAGPDDVEWVIPGAFHVRGKDDFDGHIVDEGFVGHPLITVSRLTEENIVVVAEGSVRAPKQDGTFLNLVFCDVFDMRNEKIRQLVSYLMETK